MYRHVLFKLLLPSHRCVGAFPHQLPVLPDDMLKPGALTHLVLELFDRRIEDIVELWQERVIESGEQMMQRMFAKVCQHQEIGSLDILPVHNGVQLEESPIDILAHSITFMGDVRVMVGGIQADEGETETCRDDNQYPIL